MRFIVLLCATLLYAQDTLPLSLKRAVEIALAPQGSPRVALAEESIKQAQTRVAQARAAFLPDIEAQVQDQNQTVNLRSFGLNIQVPIPGFTFPTLVGPFTV